MKVIKVVSGFEDCFYLVNIYIFMLQGVEFYWYGEKDKNVGIFDVGLVGGVLFFDIVFYMFVVDIQGEYCWWLD